MKTPLLGRCPSCDWERDNVNGSELITLRHRQTLWQRVADQPAKVERWRRIAEGLPWLYATTGKEAGKRKAAQLDQIARYCAESLKADNPFRTARAKPGTNKPRKR